MRSEDDHRRRSAAPPVRPPLAVRNAVGRVRRRLLGMAIECGGLRGLVYGLAAACLFLLVRDVLPVRPPPLAGVLALSAVGALVGALVGFATALRGRAHRMAAARAADRDLGLADRLATALELVDAGARGPFVDACLLDAARVAAGVDARRVGRRERPREAWLAPPLALLAALLLVLPPPPFDRAYDAVVARAGLDAEQPADEESKPEEKAAEKRRMADLSRREPFQRDRSEGPLPRAAESLHLATLYKDTKMSGVRPDTNAFLSEADERLKLLQHPARLPDLRQSPAGPSYQLHVRRMEEMLGSLGNSGISKKQFMELTERLRELGRRSGRRDGAFDQALRDGMEAFEAGETADAYTSMRRALDQLLNGRGGEGDRQLPPPTGEPGGEAGDDLSTAQGGPSGTDDSEGRSGSSNGQDDGAAGSHGSEAGSGGRGERKGGGEEPPAWAGRNDSFVEGALSEGESEAYDSNVRGRGAPGSSRLPFMSVLNEYRRQVEEALVKESVPRDARDRVRAYFRSLEE